VEYYLWSIRRVPQEKLTRVGLNLSSHLLHWHKILSIAFPNLLIRRLRTYHRCQTRLRCMHADEQFCCRFYCLLFIPSPFILSCISDHALLFSLILFCNMLLFSAFYSPPPTQRRVTVWLLYQCDKVSILTSVTSVGGMQPYVI